MMTKECGSCGQQKPLEEFYASPRARDGHQSHCKSCVKRRATERKWEERGIDMDTPLRALMEEANKSRCSICDRTPEEMGGMIRELAVDHNHRSRKVRGLLCHQCNAGIGLFNDDPERLRMAAYYIEFHDAADEIIEEASKKR
jgi:Recombination endonuclease VII